MSKPPSHPVTSHRSKHNPGAGWRRWRMDELETEVATPGDDTLGDSRRAEIEAQQAEARRIADMEALRVQGEQAGWLAGHKDGAQDGYEEGFLHGLALGRQQAKVEMEAHTSETIAPLAALAESFQQAVADLDNTIGSDLVELAMATGRQLAGSALEESPEQVLETIHHLLHTEPPLVGKPRLHLNTDDHSLVVQEIGHELDAAGWAVKPDSHLERGECRVTSTNGELDATWGARWDAIQSQARHRTRRPTPSGEES